MSTLDLRGWLFRLLPTIVLLHLIWWFGDVSQLALSFLKIPLETLVPMLFDDLLRLSWSADGSWALFSSIQINGASTAVLGISGFVLAKCVLWIPSALALVLATSPKEPDQWLLCAVAALLMAGAMIVICIAAHLAIFVNPEPNIWSELNPREPGLVLSKAPYPDWYFFIVSIGFYFVLNVAMLAMPVILWLVISRRDVSQFFMRF
jgi:hypothetical protein